MTLSHRTTMRLTFPFFVLFFLVAGTVDLATAQMRGRGSAGPSPTRASATLPSVDELAEAISANPTQRAALAEARLAWSLAMKEGRGATRERGGHARGERHAAGRQTPMMVFLTEAAAALDVDKTLALVELLEQTSGAQLEGRRGKHADRSVRGDRRGPRFGEAGGRGMHGRYGQGGLGSMLVKELDLSDEQAAQLEALHASTTGALRALGAPARQTDGQPTQAQLDEASRLRAEHQTRMQAILTADQHEQLLRLRAERRAEHATQAQERFATHKAERLEQLTALLDLDAGQRQKVSTALDAAHTQAAARRAERWEDSGPLPWLFAPPGEGHGASRESVQESIREVLRPQQRELYARLQSLGALGIGSQHSKHSRHERGSAFGRGSGPRR